jgi:ligand-binding sensor domain-containing protein
VTGEPQENTPRKSRRIQRWWLIVSVVVVFSAVSLAGYAASRGSGPEDLPEGWQIIRPPREVSALAEWAGLIWAGGSDGLLALDPATGEPVPEAVASLEGAASLRYVSSLLVDREGRLWVGHEAGLTVCEGATGAPPRTYTEADGLPHPWVRCLLEESGGRVWAGTFHGAAAIHEGRVTVLDSAGGLLVDEVNVVFQDSSGGLWFGSAAAPRGGLSLLVGGEWRYMTVDDGLPHNNINALIEDNNGAVWVATGFYDRGGVARLLGAGGEGGGEAREGGGGWVVAGTWDRSTGMPGAKGRSLFQARDGSLWLGTEYDGVLRLDAPPASGGYPTELQGRVFNDTNGLAHNEVKAMLQDTEGNLWLATHDGVTRIAREALARLAGNGDN